MYNNKCIYKINFMQMKKFVSNLIATGTTLLLTAPVALAQSGPADLLTPNVTQSGNVDIIAIIKLVGGWMLTIAGALGVVYLIYGGIVYITGGAKGAESGKAIIINALIGLVIVALSFAIANFVLNQFATLG